MPAGPRGTVYGLNGLRPTLRVGALHLNHRPRSALLLLRPLFRGSQSYRFAFGQKIWYTLFLSSKANFKISPKLLPKPRRASPSLKNSPAMGLPRYLA